MTRAAGFPFAIQANDDGFVATALLPEGHALFSGHFEGRPICPGVALLWFVQQTVASTVQRRMIGVRDVRFRRPLVPGMEFELRVVVREQDCRFVISTPEGPVATGILQVRDADGTVESPIPTSIPGTPGPSASALDPGQLLPHRGPALLARRVLSHDEGSIHVLASVPERSGFVVDGGVTPLLAIEMAAQAAGLHGALLAVSRGTAVAEQGYLVAVQQASLHAGLIPVGAALDVKVHLVRNMGPLSSWKGTVHLWQQDVATVAFSTFAG